MSFLRQPSDIVANEFTQTVLQYEDNIVQHRLNAAWDYALSLKYNHPGQSKEVYLAHPMRVSMLFLHTVHPMDTDGIVTAMLHNVKEVSEVQEDDLTSIVGAEIVKAISTLTVNRELQWDEDYKNKYYEEIMESPRFVHCVKILDKLDNLFLLCLNPSDDTREKYLDEIEKWVVPMTKKSLPEIFDYVRELVKENQRTGYQPL